MFPGDKKLIYALNRLHHYRDSIVQDHCRSSSRQPTEPAGRSPVQDFDRQQPLEGAADRGSQPAADGFNAPELGQGTGSAAHFPVQNAGHEPLFDVAHRESSLLVTTFDAPVLWPTMSSIAHSPVRSVAADQNGLTPADRIDTQEPWQALASAAYSPVQSVDQDELFDAADRGGWTCASGFDAPELWQQMDSAAHRPTQSVDRVGPFDAAARQSSSQLRYPASSEFFGRAMEQAGPPPDRAAQTTLTAIGETFDASLVVPNDFAHGTQPAPDTMLSKLGRWGLLPDAVQRVKDYDIRGERYTAVLGPAGPHDVQLIHLGSPPVGETFDVSFAVPENFSHRTQPAPDAMLERLRRLGFLPDADQRIMSYDIGGERYTAALGPGGLNDVQLIHHARLRPMGEAAPATPLRAPTDIYGGLESLLDLNPPTPLELRDNAHSAPVPDFRPPSTEPEPGHHRLPKLADIGEFVGPDWHHGPREASPALIDMLQTLGLLPHRDAPMTCFLINGEPYTAENLPGGRVLLFHRPHLD